MKTKTQPSTLFLNQQDVFNGLTGLAIEIRGPQTEELANKLTQYKNEIMELVNDYRLRHTGGR